MSLEYTTEGRTLIINDDGIIYIDNENNSYTLAKRKIDEIYIEQTKEQKKTGEGTIIIEGGKYIFRLNNMENANEIKKDIQYYLKYEKERPKPEIKPTQPEKKETESIKPTEEEIFFKRANKMYDIGKVIFIIFVSIFVIIIAFFISVFIGITSLIIF